MRKTLSNRKPSPKDRQARLQIARSRKQQLVAAGHVYGDLARLADVSYSMAYKWMNAERTSAECERAFVVLTAKAGAA